MQIFRLALITIVVLALVNPTEAWGRRIRRAFRRLGKSIKKLGCKVLFGIGCPAAVGAAAAALTTGSGGVGTAVGAAGATLGRNACHARKKKCRRSVVSGEILLPFSDRFSDYDQTQDKLVSYEEFVFAVMEQFPMAAPEELREPFLFADLNDDDYLDTDEFKVAPFLFSHFNSSKNDVNISMPMVNSTSTVSNETWSPAA